MNTPRLLEVVQNTAKAANIFIESEQAFDSLSMKMFTFSILFDKNEIRIFFSQNALSEIAV
jgi:hypothetical protein